MNLTLRLRQILGKSADKAAQSLETWLLKKNTLGQIDGITVCNLSMAEKASDSFLQTTREAMALIKTVDSRRYQRVCRYLSYIVNTELISCGTFNRKRKVCNVDYTKYFTSPDPLWNLHQYARLLVHEATHGLLFQRGIPYNKNTRERIERLCHLEEHRFARRFDPGNDAAPPRPFNIDYYTWYWEGPRHSIRDAWWKRLREAFRKRNALYEVTPRDAQAYNKLGLSYRDKGDSDNAISYFSHAIQLDPTFAAAYSNRGYAYDGKGEYDKALADQDKAIQLDPKLAKAYCYRGLTYRHKSAYDKAIVDYSQAITIDPQYVTAYNNRGYAYHCKGEYNTAITDFDRAIALDPKYTLAYNNRGRTHRTVGNYEKAITDYSHVVDLDPKYASAYNNLAWLLATCPKADIRDGKKAVGFALKACELYKWKSSSAVNTLALASAAAGDFESAVKYGVRYLEFSGLGQEERAEARERLAHYQASKQEQAQKQNAGKSSTL